MLGLYLHTGAASQEERVKRELEHGCTPGAPDQVLHFTITNGY